MKIVAILGFWYLSCATAGLAVAEQKLIPVTVELTPSQHAVALWAIAQPPEVVGGEVGPARPATVELYLQQLLRGAIRPDERAKAEADAKIEDTDRKTLAERLSKLTVAQCLRLASELAVTTDKLPCGASKR